MYQTRIHNGKKKNPKHRVLFEPDEEQKYAIVQDMMGNGRVRVLCEDSKVRMGRIRGSMRKYGHKTLIERGDMVIVAMRDFEEDKVDIVHKYTYDEGTYLLREGALPMTIERAWTNSMDVGGASTTNEEQYVIFGHTDEETGRVIVPMNGATGAHDQGSSDQHGVKAQTTGNAKTKQQQQQEDDLIDQLGL